MKLTHTPRRVGGLESIGRTAVFLLVFLSFSSTGLSQDDPDAGQALDQTDAGQALDQTDAGAEAEPEFSAETSAYATATSSFSHRLGFSFDRPAGLVDLEFGSRRDGYIHMVSLGNAGIETTHEARDAARISVRFLPGQAPSNADVFTNPNGVSYQLYQSGSRINVIFSCSNYYVHIQVRNRDEDIARGIAHTFRS